MILDKLVFVARLSPNSDNSDKEAYATITPIGVKMNVQPASPELVAITDGALGRTYQAWTTYSGIQNGDRVTLSGTSKVFIVKGVKDWYFPPIPHLELVLFEGDA